MSHVRILLLLNIVLLLNFKAHSGRHLQDTTAARFWADSVLRTLTPEQRIGQLFIVRANQPGKPYDNTIDRYIRDYGIGGIAFFRGNIEEQAAQTNHWQSLSQVPLFIAIDGEWGLGMRLNGIFSFPFQMTLGAIQDDSLIYHMGRSIGKQCQRMGIHINFAPVADINSNPSNPIIGMRSFGENKANVARKAIMYMRGLQDEGVIATAKHFPGHGDTYTDSHESLPVILHDTTRLDSMELYPFREMINNGTAGIMTGHLFVPSLDHRENMAATLSDRIIDSLLRKKMQFSGLIITDALDMKGVTRFHEPGEIETMALQAGNDLLLLPRDVPKAFQAISAALRKGSLTMEQINSKVRRVLFYKYLAGLHRQDTIPLETLEEDLNNRYDLALQRKLIREAITLVLNKQNILPLKHLDTLKIASVSIGGGSVTPFQQSLSNYTNIMHCQVGADPGRKQIKNILDDLKNYNLVIVAIQNTSIFANNNYGIHPSAIDLINAIQKTHTTILDIFGSPYILKSIHGFANIPALIISYQDDSVTQDLSAQLIFGGIPASGKLPVEGSPSLPAGTGLSTIKTRLEFTVPEDLGIDAGELLAIDSIVLDGLSRNAYPGCQVLASRNGKVFYRKSFGHHTYEEVNEVSHRDIYDLASITKIAATTPAVMKLSEEKRLDIDHNIAHYIPYLRGTDKETLIIREILAHQAGLKAWIPYYEYLITDEGSMDSTYFHDVISEKFPIRISEGLYGTGQFRHIIIDSIRFSKPLKKKEYRYSDLGFYLLAEAIENISNKDFEHYVTGTFYKPMGLQTMRFHPREHFSLQRIVPTENDTVFRKALIHGDVHDQGAALLGGVSGHAGLFSNATDLGAFMQMYLDKGWYGGNKYLDSTSVERFTKTQFPLSGNRKGIGFDKPMLVYEENGPACRSASASSFGHSGFTGTYTWADPENGLVYVFLSNAIHPDASNKKMLDLNIRTKIHQAFYERLPDDPDE